MRAPILPDKLIDFSLLLETIIEPTFSPDIFFKFLIFIFAFIFSFKTLMNPVLVELQRTLCITNLDSGVKSVRAIRNAAELGSELTV